MFSTIATKLKEAYRFCTVGVWRTPRNNIWIQSVKTLNLAVRSFLDRDLQNRSASLTFSTLLALVPALALIFAIGRGFGLQDLLKEQLFSYFPAQREVVEKSLTFVDSYLNQSTQGVFVGVGIVILLWTLISLLSSIEEAFNYIWDLKKDRSIYQKITDYIAICLLIPVLMICSSGVSIFMSTVIQTNVKIPFLTPIVNVALELFPLVLLWGAFSLSFLLIPNTKVKFKYAAISGIICAISFQILQMLFLNGQIYVTKYNAIYGSFAFLPLLLVWLQFSWLILLAGCTLTYCLQNVFAYNYLTDTSKISNTYLKQVAVVIGAIICRRFAEGERPYTCNQISQLYSLPIRLVNIITSRLNDVNLVNYIALSDEDIGVAPAVDISTLSVGELLGKLDEFGDSDFIPLFSDLYQPIIQEVRSLTEEEKLDGDKILLKDITVPTPEDVKNERQKIILESEKKKSQ